MGVPAVVSNTQYLTFEDYMSEGEVNLRYDIIDGVREVMTNPSTLHQHITGNIYILLRTYQRRYRTGRTIIAPADVLISTDPLRTRQPDVLFISLERFGIRHVSDPSPLSPAPELVVEVLSPNETRSSRMSKIADYAAVDVRECWLVSPEAETVELLTLFDGKSASAEIYGQDASLASRVFPGLTLNVADIFDLDL